MFFLSFIHLPWLYSKKIIIFCLLFNKVERWKYLVFLSPSWNQMCLDCFLQIISCLVSYSWHLNPFVRVHSYHLIVRNLFCFQVVWFSHGKNQSSFYFKILVHQLELIYFFHNGSIGFPFTYWLQACLITKLLVGSLHQSSKNLNDIGKKVLDKNVSSKIELWSKTIKGLLITLDFW